MEGSLPFASDIEIEKLEPENELAKDPESPQHEKQDEEIEPLEIDEKDALEQGMLPVAEDPVFTFEIFDEIIVGKVLSFLLPSERREMRLVCRFWKYLIEQHIGLDVTVNCLNHPLMDFLSTTILTTVRIRRLVNSAKNKNNSPDQDGYLLSKSGSRSKHQLTMTPSAWLKYPKRVKSLVADASAFVDIFYFTEILESCCSNLKHLKFSLQHLDLNAGPGPGLHLPSGIVAVRPNQGPGNKLVHWQARLFSLQTFQLIQSLNSSASVNSVVEQTCQILQTIRAPSLQYFSFHFNSNHVHLEMDPLISLQMALIKLVEIIGKTRLKHLYLELKARAIAWTLPPHLLRSYLSRHEFSPEFLNKISKSFPQLQHLVLRFPHTCGFRFWTLFAAHQQSLTKLVIQFTDVKLQSLLPLVQQNAKTLETLSVYANVERDVEVDVENGVGSVDFSVLQECSKLKNLHVEIPYREDRTVAPQLIQFNGGFPQSIERLDIGWLVVRSKDILLISQLPQLIHLSLIGCGEDGEFGVTIPILEKFFFNRNLQELFIYNVNHQFAQVYMRRVVGILHHLERHEVRVHVRERAFYIHHQYQRNSSVDMRVGSPSKYCTSWTWGSATVANNYWNRPPAVFVNHYAANDKLSISM